MGVVIFFILMHLKDANFRCTESRKQSRMDFHCPSLIMAKTFMRLLIASAENAVYGLKAIALNNESAIDPRSLRSLSMLSQSLLSAEASLMLICGSGPKVRRSVTTAHKTHDRRGIQEYELRLSSPEPPVSFVGLLSESHYNHPI